MKGTIQTVTVKGKDFDIKKEGASLAIECQSIFTTMIKDDGTSLDADTKSLDMLSSMTREIVHRIKYVFIECIAAPKITAESFEDLPPSIVPLLFMEIYDYQTREAEDKKKEPKESTKNQTSSETKS